MPLSKAQIASLMGNEGPDIYDHDLSQSSQLFHNNKVSKLVSTYQISQANKQKVIQLLKMFKNDNPDFKELSLERIGSRQYLDDVPEQ